MQEILSNPNLQHLNRVFSEARFELRLVGGCVRDIMLGREPKDIDLCTNATPDEMLSIADSHEIDVIATGLQHGTLTFVVGSEAFEITTLRVDVETDGRHAQVEYTRSFEEDAARRDLTFNAMSMDFEGNVYDYFNGATDLNLNRVRFVGDAQSRIREDYLRILRYFRFAARFNSEMDSSTLNAIYANREGLRSISVERIWMEMKQIFVAPNADEVLFIMREYGVLEVIGLPNHRFGALGGTSPEGSIASHFRDPNSCRDFCNFWKLSKAETDKAAWITECVHNPVLDEFEVKLHINVNQIDREWIIEAINIRYGRCEIQRILEEFARKYVQVTFPLKGQDLLDEGMSPGKEIGQKLAAAKILWVINDYSQSKNELLAELKINV